MVKDWCFVVSSLIISGVAVAESTSIHKDACELQPPAWVSWANDDPNNCDFQMSGITFHKEALKTQHTTPGSEQPDYSTNERFIYPKCVQANALWWDNHIHNGTVGQDLQNPTRNSYLRYYWIKNSVHEGTTRGTAAGSGHEDLLQTHTGLVGGGLIIQDSIFKNGDTNAFIDHGTGYHGFGNGGSGNPKCVTDNGEPVIPGVRYLIYQGLQLGPNDEGYSGGLQWQMSTAEVDTHKGVDEIWLIDVTISDTIGMAISGNTGKVIVVGGNGGLNGWPGPLRSRYSNSMTELTMERCSGEFALISDSVLGERYACSKVGLVNDANNDGVADFPFSWDGRRGDNPEMEQGLPHLEKSKVVPIYYYPNLEAALAAGHAEPPAIRVSCAGWKHPHRNADKCDSKFGPYSARPSPPSPKVQ